MFELWFVGSLMKDKLRAPCAYQGGKQRIAAQIVDLLIKEAPDSDTIFYDLCCGSAAVSIELINRGIDPSRIFMLDKSSWGVFWSAIGSGSFNMELFDLFLSMLPEDKKKFKDHISELAALPIIDNEVEIYPLLQSCSFGGKQIWRNGQYWANACFRNYWEPTETSIRRSPANPMQPSATELRRRIDALVKGMKGVNCFNDDIITILDKPLPINSVVYVDPPYKGTTKYAFSFDLDLFIKRFCEINKSPLFVSEGAPLNENAVMLNFIGANGGISGVRKIKHQEWISRF